MDSLSTILKRVQANVELNFTTQQDFEVKYRQVLGKAYCHTCEGTERVSTPWSRGAASASWPCPDCLVADDPAKYERKLRTSGLSLEWSNQYVFDKWNPNKNPQLMDQFRVVRSWAQNPEGLLLLAGGVGVGKTHLAIATAINVIQMGWHVRYIEVQGLIKRMQGAMDQADTSAEAVYQAWGIAPDLVVLDDLGFEQHTEYSLGVVENLLSWRLLRNKPTVVTTNTGLEPYSDRLQSRLHEKGKVTLIKLDGKDIRVTG